MCALHFVVSFPAGGSRLLISTAGVFSFTPTEDSCILLALASLARRADQVVDLNGWRIFFTPTEGSCILTVRGLCILRLADQVVGLNGWRTFFYANGRSLHSGCEWIQP